MDDPQLNRLDLNLLVVFEALMEARSVLGAAEKLGKTPSAVSHALARLREQVGDPLMVKVGSRMQPSPFALRLIEDVRPILRAIQRAVQPPAPFDPGTSRRVFRICVPAFSALISRVTSRVNARAPHVGLEWLPPLSDTYAKVIDEQIDLALQDAEAPLPDGISEQVMPPLRRYVFARAGHPALGNWTREAWLSWPHVMVGMSNTARQTVEDRMAKLGAERRIGARIPDFSGVAPIIAGTDMFANQTPLFLLSELEALELRLLEPPEKLPALSYRFFWSSRLLNDPESRWIREIVIESFLELVNEAEALVDAADIVAARGV